MDRSEARLDLSVVVPMFNEAGNLTPLVDSIGRALTGLGRSFEVLIVDDGSSDGSAEELDAASIALMADVRIEVSRGEFVVMSTEVRGLTSDL